MKRYDIYFAGGEKATTIFASCITKACKSFIETLEKEAVYKLNGKEYASISYKSNYSIFSDFVVINV